jgi:hypothetical protein
MGGLSGSAVAVGSNTTLDKAQLLGDLTTDPQARVAGTILNDATGAGEVNWFSFTLDGPARVTLDLQPRGGASAHALAGVLSLYDNDPLDFQDLYDPTGYRLLVQAAGGGTSDATISRELSPGTYFVAVSGAGDLYFHPLLAGSGLPGATGDYTLKLSGSPINVAPTDGPTVLTSEPAPGAVLDTSPFVIRLDMSAPLDPATVIAGQTVSLTYNPDGTFGDGNDQEVPLAWTNVGVGGTELQLAPTAPLAPGAYKVVIAGDSSTEPSVVADLNGNALGATAANPQGQDYTETFQVAGIKGRTGPGAGSDDTPATAQNLGALSSGGFVQVAGAIGDDPYYDNSDPAHNPANDVDLYHFQISGPGRYAVIAEVFAGRIGSPLNPGVSLYSVNPSDGTLEFLAGNNNTNNDASAPDGSDPLELDSWLSQGLTAGNYYLAVADGNNTPSPSEFLPVGSPGLLDPNVAHSAQNGFTTGPYVLNLMVQATPQPPQVLATYPAPGAVLNQAPSELTVQFSEPVNVQQQGYVNFIATNDSAISSVFVQGPDGTDYYPRINSIDPATNQATFLMFDRLAPGNYTLHLSGAQGLADLGGNPLAGNDRSGDYVVHFTVKGTSPVQTTGSGQGGHIQSQLGPTGSQNLGILFPHELQAGITVVAGPGQGSSATPATSSSPSYQFTIALDQGYIISLNGSNLPTGAHLTLQARSGKLFAQARPGSRIWYGEFTPGSYTVTVVGVPPGAAYQINFAIGGNADPPVPLVTGAGPALQLHFDAFAPPGLVDGAAASSGGEAPGTPPSTPGSGSGDPSTPGGGATTPDPTGPAGPESPSTTGGSTGASSTPAAGGGGPLGPAPIAPGTSGLSAGAATSTGGSPPPLTTLIIVNVPAVSPGTAPVSTGPTGAVANEPAGATVAARSAAAGAAFSAIGSQVESLVAANLALLGVGPVGGVQQGSGSAAAVQVVQVALPTQGNSPVPMGLVSLVTLTRSGDPDDPPVPAGPAGLEAELDGDPGGGAVVAARAAAPAASPRPGGDGDPRVGTEVTRTRTTVASGREDARADGASGSLPQTAAARAQAWAATTLPVQASSPNAGSGGLAACDTDNSAAGIDSLAAANGPWLLLAATLGAIVVYLRKRRTTARSAAARVRGAAARPPAGLARHWGLRMLARHRPAHGMRPISLIPARRNATAAALRPRHMNNP